jgi:hypothetical protein
MQRIGYGAKRGGRGHFGSYAFIPPPHPSPASGGGSTPSFSLVIPQRHSYLGNSANAFVRSISARRASERNPDS